MEATALRKRKPDNATTIVYLTCNVYYSFESADGTKMEESGSQKQVGEKPEETGTVSKGSYSYVSPDGTTITVNWVADENGFQATGDHLPTPPPMPEHVVKMLADLRAAGVLRR